MSEYSTSRRSVLRFGGTALAAGLTSGTAGCLGTFGLGGRSPDTYRSWVPDPAVWGHEHYGLFFARPAAIDEHRHELNRDFYDRNTGFEGLLSFLPVRGSDLDWLIFTGNLLVASGEYEAETVVAELRRNGFTYREDYGGYEIYEGQAHDIFAYAVAVSDETIAWGREPRPQGGFQAALEYVKTAIDADQGDIRRFHQVSTYFEDVTDVIGAPERATAHTHEPYDQTDTEQGRFRNQVATAAGIEIDGETADLTVSLVFLADRDVYASRIESWTRQSDGFRRVYDIEIEQNDHVAIVEGTIDSRDLEALPI